MPRWIVSLYRLVVAVLAATSALVTLAGLPTRPATAAPRTAAGTADGGALHTFLRQHYGEPDATGSGWRGLGGDAEGGRLWQVCAERVLPDPRQRLLAVCGRQAGGGAHAEAGSVDLYLLQQHGSDRRTRQAGDDWHVLTRLADLPSGSFGSPGEVRVVQLGPSWYGFAVLDRYQGNGQVVASLHLYAPTHAGMAEVLALNTGYDNAGLHACRPQPTAACRDVQRHWQFEAVPDQPAFVLRIDEQWLGNQTRRQLRHRLAFDAGSGRYRLPSTLEPWLE